MIKCNIHIILFDKQFQIKVEANNFLLGNLLPGILFIVSLEDDHFTQARGMRSPYVQLVDPIMYRLRQLLLKFQPHVVS